ncbi:MAG TPA: methyltransferase domain-containing protein [Polyangiaceae bacterium]|nr:methyltransferase domain-containing protein [Polyangiaceae bacterium]
MRIIAIGSEDAQNSILPVRPVAGKPRPNASEASAPEASAPEASAPEASAPKASAPEASRSSAKERPAALTPSGSRHEPPPIPDGLLDRASPRIESELLEPPHGLELIQLSTTESASDAQQLLPQPIPDDDVAAIESERSPTSGMTTTDDEAVASGRRRPPPPRRVSFPSGAISPETPSTPPSAIGVDPSPSGPIERVPAPVRESAPRQPPPAPSRVPRDPSRSPNKLEVPQRVSIVEGEEAAAVRPAGKPEPPQRVSIVEGEEAAAARPAGKPEPPQRVSIVEGEEAPKQRPAPRRLWWDELFGEDFSRAMARLSDAQVDLEVSFIEESLGVAPGAAVLDLGCGAGYHAIELASRGYGVVGYDLSLHQLSLAQEIAQERGQKLNFMQGDMREMAFEEVFDGMYCWNTTFGYFEEDKNVQVAERMFAALKPGGTLLLDVANRDFVAMDQPSSVWYEGDACVCMDDMSVDFFTSRLRVKRSLILDDGRTRECHYSIRLYSLHELGRILHDIGFRVTEASGNPITPGVFLGQNSPRIIILAQKP